MIEALFSMGFATGLLGSAHCAGMCGGLCGALATSREGGGVWSFLLLYQVGRIATYVLLGFLGASLGAYILYTPWFSTAARWLLIASDLLVIMLGLMGLRLLPGTGAFPDTGDTLKGPMAALVLFARRFPAPVAALVLGLLFGFLPCGFLYPVLIAAVQTAEPSRGALTMLGFGLGTAPALLAAGKMAAHLKNISRRMMAFAWLGITLLGFFNLYRHLAMSAGPCCG